MAEKTPATPPIKEHVEIPRLEASRTEATGFRVKDIEILIKLGISNLPRLEKGTMRHGSSERLNRQRRIDFLKEHLGIKADQVPRPSESGEILSERLVADMLVDIITTAQVIADLENEYGDKLSPVDIKMLNEALILPLNELIHARKAKGALISIKLPSNQEDEILTLRQFALKRQCSPARSDNPTKPGDIEVMLTLLEEKLIEQGRNLTPPAS